MERFKKLLVTGPYDRYNYGDLLFPYMIENEIGKKYDSVIYLSTTESDLRDVGGKKTLSFKYLESLESGENYTLILAGGHSLLASWGELYAHLSPTFNFFYEFRGFRLTNKISFLGALTYEFFNYLGRKFLKGKSYLPLSVSLGEFPQIKTICYNSVGTGGSLKLYNALKNKFNRTFTNISYLSVRDNHTFNMLNENGVKVKLVPDSAILVSKFFPPDLLKTKVNKKIMDFLDENNGYCFFHIGKHIGLKNIDTFVEQMEMLYNETNYQICLCSLGNTLAHEDIEGLSKIASRLRAPHILFNDVSIWDIMLLIAESKICIGTSLHGVVTAMSFCVPYLGVEAGKIAVYLKTWAVEGLNKVAAVNEISTAALSALKVPLLDLRKNLKLQRELVEKSLKFMSDL